MATSTLIKSTAGTTSWVCPLGVTSVTVKAWGGGGSGSGRTTQGTGGGGAGGQFAQKVVTVTPGTSYSCVVAAAKAGTTAAGAAGNDTTFASTTVVAKGGAGGTNTAGGTGATTSGVGDTVYAGGNGAPPNGTTSSGGGGGGAGTTGAGGAASTTTGGTGTSLSGGAGGAGRTTAGAGAAGSTAGGGGSGAWRAASTNQNGGGGAIGRMELSWTNPVATTFQDNFNDNSINTNIWNTFADARVTESSGCFNIATLTTATYHFADSQYMVDLTGSEIAVQLVNAGNQSLTSYEAYPIQLMLDANNLLSFMIAQNVLHAYKKVTSTQTEVGGTGVAYNSSTMKWFRIRESGGRL